MSAEDRTVQLADDRGTAEVMQGDRCVVVTTSPPGEPLIVTPGQARRLGRILSRSAYLAERPTATEAADQAPASTVSLADLARRATAPSPQEQQPQ